MLFRRSAFAGAFALSAALLSGLGPADAGFWDVVLKGAAKTQVARGLIGEDLARTILGNRAFRSQLELELGNIGERGALSQLKKPGGLLQLERELNLQNTRPVFDNNRWITDPNPYSSRPCMPYPSCLY